MSSNGGAEARDRSGVEPPLKPWETVNREVLLERSPWLKVEQEAVRLPGGQVIPDFYRITLPRFVLIVALTGDRKIVYLRSYKHGVRGMTRSVPSGMVESEELPLAAAQRELYEETGYTAARWTALGSYVVDGNRQCGTAYLFLAEDAVRTGPGGEGDDLEDVRVELADPCEFLESAVGGEVSLLPTVAAVGLALEALRAGFRC